MTKLKNRVQRDCSPFSLYCDVTEMIRQIEKTTGNKITSKWYIDPNTNDTIIELKLNNKDLVKAFRGSYIRAKQEVGKTNKYKVNYSINTNTVMSFEVVTSEEKGYYDEFFSVGMTKVANENYYTFSIRYKKEKALTEA